jgi:hypothetical protein
MSKNGKVLPAARELMERQRVFGPPEHAVLLRGALEEGFDAATNGTDAMIDTLLNGLYGFPWRAHVLATRDEDLYNEAERSRLMAAATEVATKQVLHDKAFDKLLLAESVYRNPPETATIEMLRSFGVRHDRALKEFEKARDELEEALPKVTEIKVQAQRRRVHEATATMELHHQPSEERR